MMETTYIIQIAMGLCVGGLCGIVLGFIGHTLTKPRVLVTAWQGGICGALLGTLYMFFIGSYQLDISPSKALQIKTVQDFQTKVLNAHQPVLVDFYSNSCPPCRRLAPTIDKLAAKYKGRALVAKVNVQRLPQLAHMYNIRGIPAVLFFVEGQETGRMVGLNDQQAYTTILNDLSG